VLNAELSALTRATVALRSSIWFELMLIHTLIWLESLSATLLDNVKDSALNQINSLDLTQLLNITDLLHTFS
jgi:hypothetical protein